ncbi:unnamed protein product [Oikopleura dioica]|uniref:B-related factor 1 n=1 Tax=Oikopleura dioica TaxID=34765 RepID=E4XSQ2_OIKDI|nr:unnamed protein product [Oikopleura dioica]
MGTKCKKCGQYEAEEDPTTGTVVCTNCGAISEENQIVSSIQFTENAGGSSIIGTFHSADGLNNSVNHIGSRNHREVTLRKAKESICRLCAELRLPKQHEDEAYNYYRLALNKSFTRGRRAEQVYASCVYLSCRLNPRQNELMLLDFSQVLKVNVYILGKTFLKLSQELNITPHMLDPVFYIHRFAHQLGFGDSGTKNKEVMETSNRIVQRMNRDWMTEGRRPAGICGAAFVIAARMHGFRCNIEDITKVFKIGPNTIRKRLHEFGATPSAKLTIDEFNRIDLESEFDPPSFIKAQEEAAKKFDNEEIDRQVTEAEALIPEIDQAMTEDQKKAAKRKRRPKKASGDAEEVPSDPELQMVHKAGFLDPLKTPEEALARLNPNFVGSSDTPSTSRPENGRLESLLPNESYQPTVESLGITRSHAEMLSLSDPSMENNVSKEELHDGELDLEGIDDDEISCMILNEAEVSRKTTMWENRKENKEWVKRQEEKRLEEASNPPKAKRARKRRGKSTLPEYSTAGEALQTVIKQKRFSTNINYDVLNTLKEALSTSKEVEQKKSPIKIIDKKKTEA